MDNSNATEALSVALSMILAIALGISLFAGNQTEKLTIKSIITMVVTGVASGIITWTYLTEGETTKVVVRNILLYTFSATVFSKLIGRVINSFTNIPEKEIQKLGLDYLRKRAGLSESEIDNYESETIITNITDSVDTDADGHTN